MVRPSSTVVGLAQQKLKVFKFIVPITVIASVVHSVIPFMSCIIGEMFIGVSDAFPIGESVLYPLLMSDFLSSVNICLSPFLCKGKYGYYFKN